MLVSNTVIIMTFTSLIILVFNAEGVKLRLRLYCNLFVSQSN